VGEGKKGKRKKGEEDGGGAAVGKNPIFVPSLKGGEEKRRAQGDNFVSLSAFLYHRLDSGGRRRGGKRGSSLHSGKKKEGKRPLVSCF